MRCPRCGAEAPDDVAWCPRCGKAFELEILDLGGEDGPQAPPPVETGRDRRPLLVVSVVVAVLLGGLLLTSGGGDDGEGQDAEPEVAERAERSTSTTTTTARRRSRPSVRRTTSSTVPPPISAEPIGARIVLGRSDELILVDLATGTLTERDVPELEVAQDQFPPMRSGIARRGELLAFQGEGGTYVMSPFGPDPPRRVGESVLFAPARRDNELWLVTVAPGKAPAIRRWRTDGVALTGLLPLPPDWTPVGEVDAGLVLRRNDRFQVWDPMRATTVFASDPSVNLIAVGERLVAWQTYCDGPLCTVHLTNPASGVDRVVYMGGLGVDYGIAAFSPGESHLVMPGHQLLAGGTWSQGVVVVDVIAASVRFTQDALVQPGQVAWSPDGQWAFLTSIDGSTPRMGAYSPAEDRFVPLRLPRGADGLAMAVFAPP